MMELKQTGKGGMFFMSALIMLVIGMVIGLLSGIEYIFPAFLSGEAGFEKLRPMHVSAVLFWLLLGATACVYGGLESIKPGSVFVYLKKVQWVLWMAAITGIFYAYFNGDFGGREYWEFNPIWALPIVLAWVLLIINFFKAVWSIPKWPVYVWMWMTGILFFLFTFIENYLWVFPFFRDRMVTDMTIQWKVNGSLVGSWNQILYGTLFFLMDKIDKTAKVGNSKIAFALFFLGLFNLMFNWGHHIYTLPTEDYIRYIGYAVSMTEWVFLIKIIYNWRSSVTQANKLFHYFPYRFILAAEIWVFINLGHALLMSIPALNLYTHGTHVTVAHAMGTTIGINSMILLAAGFELFAGTCIRFDKGSRLLKVSFWTAQLSLLIFWLSLNAAGLIKGFWQMGERKDSFADMMQNLSPYFIIIIISGTLLTISLSIPAFVLIKSFIVCKIREASQKKSGIKNLKIQYNIQSQ